MIENIKNIYYIHIPKTAGTSLEDIFYNYGGCISLCYFNKYKISNSIISEQKYKNLSLWHIPFQFLDASFVNKIIDNYLIFTVVRNPYDKIISVYKFWIGFYCDRINKNKHELSFKEHYLMKQIKYIYENDFNINKNNLNKFINKVLTSKNFYTLLDGHLIPSTEYIIAKKKKKLIIIPNIIMKFENLNNDFNYFIQKYKLDIPINIIQTTKINISKGELAQSDLNYKSIELINKIYKYDFKFFNYVSYSLSSL